MVGLTRRRKVEGWAVDVAETDDEVGRSTLLQRLADSNKLWIGSLVLVVFLCLFLARNADKARLVNDKYHVAPTAARGSCNDAQHRAFSSDFVRGSRGRLRVLEAEFLSLDRFRIVIPVNMNRDDIEFITKLAGLKVVNQFHYRPVVQAYTRSMDGSVTLAATAQWEASKYGFVVRLPNAKRR